MSLKLSVSLLFMVGCQSAKESADFEFVSVPGTKCMSGAETGFWMKKGSSNKLGIYLNGGGACFNRITCGTATSDAKGGKPGTGGIWASDTRNPLANFSWISVPYCTGDVHLGSITHQFAGSNRYFQGHNNLGLIMKQVVKTFPNIESLYVSGESAGGFGAIANYDYLRSFYSGSNVRAIMVDDSGPIMDDQAIPVCLQELWRTTWNINSSLPAGCPCIGNQGNIVSVWEFTKTKWPKDSFGLVSSVNDGVISTFFGFGDLDCKTPIPGAYNKIHDGIKRLSDSGVPVYMIPGSGHTHTHGSEFYSRVVDNTALYQWVGQLVAPGADPGSVIVNATDFVVV